MMLLQSLVNTDGSYNEHDSGLQSRRVAIVASFRGLRNLDTEKKSTNSQPSDVTHRWRKECHYNSIHPRLGGYVATKEIVP
jgi:hypothetical protein